MGGDTDKIWGMSPLDMEKAMQFFVAMERQKAEG